MKILAIDTSTKYLCLGVYDNAKFYEYNLKVEKALSELLIPTIKRVLGSLNLKVENMDYFACGLGPGSFTGLRIGMAAVKGFSVALNRPVAGVSSLDILARNAPSEEKRLIVTAVDARRDLIYSSAYKNEKGILKKKSDYALLSIGDFINKFKKTRPLILGDALVLHGNKMLAFIKGAAILDKDYWMLKPYNLMELAVSKIKSAKLSSAAAVKPVYLYPKECQIKIK